MATNPTPQPDSPKDLQLINIVDDFIHSITRRHIPDYPEAKDFMVKLGAYYTNKFLELLKDEGAAFDDKYKLMYVGVRNELRAELRQAIKNLNKAQLASEDTAIKQLSKRGE